MKELIKKRKMDNIVLDIVIFMVVIMTIIISYNDFKELFIDDNVINDISSYNTYKNNKYISIDLSDAKITRLSIENIATKEKEINIYKLTYDNDTLLVFLNNNTILTNKVNGKLITPSGTEEEAKKLLNKELTTNVLDKVFSNVNYQKEKDMVKLRIEMCLVIMIFCIFSFIFNMIGYLNPEKTRTYRKYEQKNNVD